MLIIAVATLRQLRVISYIRFAVVVVFLWAVSGVDGQTLQRTAKQLFVQNTLCQRVADPLVNSGQSCDEIAHCQKGRS